AFSSHYYSSAFLVTATFLMFASALQRCSSARHILFSRQARGLRTSAASSLQRTPGLSHSTSPLHGLNNYKLAFPTTRAPRNHLPVPLTAARMAATSAAAAAAAAPSDVPQEPAQAYEALCGRLRELSALNGISGLLDWDEMVMMPAGSADSRGAQKAALAGVMYDKQTDPQLGALLAVLRAAPKGSLDEVQSSVVRDAHKEYVKATALPKELAQRIARLKTDAYAAWVEARKSADFSLFAPFLQQWVDISKEKARLIDPCRPAYDVLLDDYEKGLTSARLDEVFSEVRAGLVPLIADIKSRGRNIDCSWMEGEYDTAVQAELCNKIALDLGFDTSKGRLDVSVHPFTGGAHPTDVRMTTRFKKEDVTEGVSGAIHETGHALYEQGRPASPAWADLPVSSALSMGVHESQSLLWERMVGLGRPFATYLLPLLRERFPDRFPPAVTPEQLYESQNTIREPSLIRVESDEVTYPLHIILRYELEAALMEGRLAVEQVPAEWNRRMSDYLGACPPDDAKGCLQDVHWCMGAFGYFPTYTLGAMYATQLYDAAAKDIPDLVDKIAAGDFKPLKSWLNANVHALGSLPASGDELMVAVTGAPLQPGVFLNYLRGKYGELYGIA
ncbi:hypothetical protein Agub_g12106, partial [Astrephomene gubernaculifera]